MYSKRELQRFAKFKMIYFEKLIKFGFTNNQIEKDFKKENIQEGDNQRLNDFIWYRLNLALSKFPTDFNQQYLIYLEQRSFLHDTKSKKDLTYLNKLIFESKKQSDYLAIKGDSGLKWMVSIIVKINNCEKCASEREKKYDIEYFYKNYKLPHEGCTCEKGCTCWYGLGAERDKDGRLIFIDDYPGKKYVKSNNLEYKKHGASLILKTLKFLKLIK